MDRPTVIPLRIGAWYVDPRVGQISRQGEVVRVEARTMKLLLCLAGRAGEAVSIDDLLEEVWSGVVVTQDSVYQAVASLRRLLGDDARQPEYIATVPRLGYRMVATVSPWVEDLRVQETRVEDPKKRRRAGLLLAAALGLCVALVAAFSFKNEFTPSTRSVAVMPFLDLTTQEMNEEYFADGMTEELIDRLTKIPGLRVPPPTASFYFKGKKVSVAEIAKSLGVAYLLDGSVRKSDATLRIAARLVRAADGYVVWSETYDRPSGDKLQVQDDIAREVAKQLRTAIH
jgi:transcriptional activator of cad operon